MGAKRAKHKRKRYVLSHTIPARPPTFSNGTAVAFFTSWSNSFTEIFSRAVVRVFELWRQSSGRDDLHLIPAMWGSSWGPDYARAWLSPFTAHPVQPLALTPPGAG